MPISVDEQKKVAVLDIERFLQNIGAFGGDKVTHEDVETIVSELGESVRAEEGIRADKIVTKLFWKTTKPSLFEKQQNKTSPKREGTYKEAKVFTLAS